MNLKMESTKKTIRSLNSLSSKISNKYPNIDSKTIDRFESIVMGFVKNGRNDNKINDEDLKLLKELLDTVDSTRKEQDTDDTLEFLSLILLLIIAFAEDVEKKSK